MEPTVVWVSCHRLSNSSNFCFVDHRIDVRRQVCLYCLQGPVIANTCLEIGSWRIQNKKSKSKKECSTIYLYDAIGSVRSISMFDCVGGSISNRYVCPILSFLMGGERAAGNPFMAIFSVAKNAEARWKSSWKSGAKRLSSYPFTVGIRKSSPEKKKLSKNRKTLLLINSCLFLHSPFSIMRSSSSATTSGLRSLWQGWCDALHHSRSPVC